ncbi:MAG: hypothetical protein AAFN42_01560 [Cyanobacteria bacterium J06554_1]
MLNPQDKQRSLVEQLASKGQKILLLGHLGVGLASDFGVVVDSMSASSEAWDDVSSFVECDVSNSLVEYDCEHLLTATLKAKARALRRYDFTDEWNTLGFGRITVDRGPWSLCQLARTTQAHALSKVIDSHGQELTLYAAIANTPDSSILWFNRAVGPIDSLEWTIIETFCSHYRADELVCIPHIMEIPAGYGGAVTMRLDCDQGIATARPLFELYQELGVPLSLAVVTGLPPQPNDMAFLREVLAHGGAVVSHSCTHPPNWGVDYAAALQEAKDSKAWLQANLPEAGAINYAVSPFHQNPAYAVQALADADYMGFVGGIIHNDPEYLLGRSGQVPLCDKPLISHSQQCMLHGDCYHRYGNSVEPYCESFAHHFKAGLLFGYLDHPFSAAYQYGWDTEEERLSAHRDFLTFIQSQGNIWFPNLVQCLDFVRKRSLLNIDVDKTQSLRVRWQPTQVPLQATPPLQVGWRGETIPISA